jgi:endonuclease/exonuclease/phosphatase family metal-dependent hydrolase
MSLETFRFATFNVRCGPSEDGPNHWDRRKELLLETVGMLKADLLGVQECYPHQADEIGMRFPNRCRLGVGRYHGVERKHRMEEARSGEHCAVFFDPLLLEAESCGTFWHSDSPDEPASMSWGNDLPRITTWVALRSRASGKRFVYFNTHFHHWGDAIMERTTDLHLKRIPSIAAGLPVLLAGDFNLPPSSAAHQRLCAPPPRGLGLRDAWELLGRPEDGAGSYHDFTGEPKVRIDWILAGPGITPLSVQRVDFNRDGRFPSDHYPVAAELGLD